MKILIKNGRLVDPASNLDRIGDVAIANGRIVKLGDVGEFAADRTIDATGLIVAPGLVDLCARLRELLSVTPRGSSFGNARFVRNVLEAAIGHHAWRLREIDAPTVEQLRALEPDDVVVPDLPAPEEPVDPGVVDLPTGETPSDPSEETP